MGTPFEMFRGEWKQEKAQPCSFWGLTYIGTLTRIYPSTDILFQNMGSFIPENCLHRDKTGGTPDLGCVVVAEMLRHSLKQ